VRAAGAAASGPADQRFGFTGELPTYEATHARMTGSMPLIDESQLAGVDFALPEYDDPDFSADMEPPPDPRVTSAAGERHAEEISKILAETDVYVKYNLHQKAVDHLRRVFALDGDNVEARERLKDILVSQGREQEAEVELLKLAEVVAPGDPDRAEGYLQELFALSGTHTGAFELARRFRLRVARMSSASAELEVAPEYPAGVATVDRELDELELAPPPRARSSAGGPRSRSHDSRDSIDDFDPDELIGNQIAHGSPAPGRPPRRPNGAYQAEVEHPESFELEFEPSPSQATRQMAPEVFDALAASRAGEDDDEDSLIVDRPPPRWHEARAIDAQLDDAELDGEIDRQVARDTARSGRAEDLPFDRDEARAFDAAVPKVADVIAQTDAIYVNGFDDSEPVHGPGVAVDTSSFDAVPEDARHSGGYDPYGTDAIHAPSAFGEPTATSSVSSGFAAEALAGTSRRAESNVEDELDMADFYAGQGMAAEAIEVLSTLLQRVPGHRMVLAKLHEIQAAAGLDPTSGDGATVASDALELDDLEEMGVDDLVELGDDSQPVKHKRHPTVMLEKPVDDADSDTHYDLGLAYKEMTLLDEAIKAFEKALRAPGREVQCRVMIGMCLRDMGSPTEAIQQFKQGLHAQPSERERQSLHYEIGVTYEAIGDDAEALYYFEMVLKRDPGFADTTARTERLRARGGRPMHTHDDDL
jgi:tetratricopeptide (TPR) repeat protein